MENPKGTEVDGGGDDAASGPVLELLLDTRKRIFDTTSTSSSQLSYGPRESTPLNSQEVFDSEEFFREEDGETEPPSKVT